MHDSKCSECKIVRYYDGSSLFYAGDGTDAQYVLSQKAKDEPLPVLQGTLQRPTTTAPHAAPICPPTEGNEKNKMLITSDGFTSDILKEKLADMLWSINVKNGENVSIVYVGDAKLIYEGDKFKNMVNGEHQQLEKACP